MPSRVSEHIRVLGVDVDVLVRIEVAGGRLARYSVVLRHRGRAVRSFDNAHGQHDMHRYDEQGRRLPAEKFSEGTVQDGLDAALAYVQESWQRIIEQ